MSCGQACDVYDVLDGDGDTVQRADIRGVLCDPHIGFFSGLERPAGVDRHVRMQRRIEAIDALDVLPNEIDRRSLPPPNGLCLLDSIQPDHRSPAPHRDRVNARTALTS